VKSATSESNEAVEFFTIMRVRPKGCDVIVAARGLPATLGHKTSFAGEVAPF
jgi:hypothetical protein